MDNIAIVRVNMSTRTNKNIRLGELCIIVATQSYLGLFAPCASPLWYLFTGVDLFRDNVGLIFSVKEDWLVEL